MRNLTRKPKGMSSDNPVLEAELLKLLSDIKIQKKIAYLSKLIT